METAQKTAPSPLNCQEASYDELVHALKNRLPISGIETILTHCPPVHFEEMAAITILRETPEGPAMFPGIENAHVAFTSATNLEESRFDKFSGFIRALQNGMLILGVGRGHFDEHGDRENKKSCFQLVVNHLDLMKTHDNRMMYGKIRHFINYEDNNGDNILKNLQKAKEIDIDAMIAAGKIQPVDRFDEIKKRSFSETMVDVMKTLHTGEIAQNIKKGFEAAESIDEQMKVFNMGIQFIRNEIGYQRLFVEACYEYDRLKSKNSFNFFDLEGHVGVVLKSDYKQISNAVWYKLKKHNQKPLGLLILHNSKGQFFIKANDFLLEKEMKYVVGILRQKVYSKRNNKPLPVSAMHEYGTLSAVPELYFDENQFMIMNGSKTDPDTPGLIGKDLSIEDIIEAVKIAINGDFEPGRAVNCLQSKCDGKKCPFYNYHLKQCAQVKLTSQFSSKGTGTPRAGS